MMNSWFIRVGFAICLWAGFGALSVATAVPVGNFETLTQSKIEQTYYFDWNRNIKFRAALMQAFKRSNTAIPAWVRQGSGPASPAKVAHQGSTHWVIVNTCKAHDCGNNQLYVAFDPPTRTTAAVAKFNSKVVWIGNPQGELRAILSQHSGIQ